MSKGKDGKVMPQIICQYGQIAKYCVNPFYGTSNAINHIQRCPVYINHIAKNLNVCFDYDKKYLL